MAFVVQQINAIKDKTTTSQPLITLNHYLERSDSKKYFTASTALS